MDRVVDVDRSRYIDDVSRFKVFIQLDVDRATPGHRCRQMDGNRIKEETAYAGYAGYADSDSLFELDRCSPGSC